MATTEVSTKMALNRRRIEKMNAMYMWNPRLDWHFAKFGYIMDEMICLQTVVPEYHYTAYITLKNTADDPKPPFRRRPFHCIGVFHVYFNEYAKVSLTSHEFMGNSEAKRILHINASKLIVDRRAEIEWLERSEKKIPTPLVE
jgi:hypothetical protein